MTENLFHPDLKTRYLATLQLNCDAVQWPKGCWGAANGWLMLVGPSPGKDLTMEGKTRESVRPKETVHYGAGQGKINFKDGSPTRIMRWNKLAQVICGNEQYANALTSVANLDWFHHGAEKKLAREYLKNGCKDVWEVILKSKPRVIIALTNSVWDIFGPCIPKSNVSDIVVPSQLTRPPIVFQIPGYSAPSLFLKSPQHPSWPYKSDYYVCLEETVKRFLEQVH